MTTPNLPQKGKFFLLEPDLRIPGPGHGVVFENEKQLLTHPSPSLRPWEGGFPVLKEIPRLVHDPKKGSMPLDLEASFGGYWLVSERLKKVFEDVDPQAFEFAEVDFRLASGARGPGYFLCDVVRVLDAVDEDRSTLRIEQGADYIDGKVYNFSGGAHLAMRRDVVGAAHAFQLKFSLSVFCDRVMLDAIRGAGIAPPERSDGLWFIDAADWTDA